MCMYKKNMCLISVILLLSIVGSALAVDTDWTNAGGDRQWDNASNWDAGIPTSANKAGIRASIANGPIIDSGTTAVAGNIVCGDWGYFGVIDITGGTLTLSGWFILGYSAGDLGTFNVSGGTTTCYDHIDIGRGGTGQMNMTAGTVTVPNGTFGIATVGGSGDVQLDGGTISCSSFSMATGATMDFTNTGTLIVNGDVTSTIDGYISSGWMTAYDGGGTVSAEYNGANPGKTTVTGQSPEKASYPSPGNGAAGVDLDADLSWTAGIYAISHDVYFGTDSTPDETEFIRNQPETTYDPGTMDVSTTYYWRIDEVNDAYPESPWIGDVWTFETYSGTASLRKGPYIIYPGNNTEMTVLWQLDESMPCSIEWGTDTTYSDGSANTSEYGDDYQHKHTITGLTPGTKYFYKVTVGTLYATGSFRAAPSASATDVKFLVYGDTRTYPSIHNTVAGAIVNTFELDPDYQTILLHDGDFVNAGLTEIDWTVEFFDPAQLNIHEMLGNIPLNGAQGNHERQVNGGKDEGWLYLKYFPYPYVGGYYWSYDYGPAHIAVVDEYFDYSTGSAQLTWLENDLANTTKEWKFLIYHEPGWSAGGHNDNTNIQTYIHPLCVQYGVDICLSGHNHYYCRCGVDGVKHITTGGGGAPLGSPKPDWNEYIETCTEANHYCKINIVGAELTLTAVKPDGTVIDTFSLIHSVCGDDTCDPGECCVADCGTPPSTETNCTDGYDNDCDTYTDCADADCDLDPACSCGNGTCDPGEDCLSCPDDCISRTTPPKFAYCCGDGTCEGEEDQTNCAVDCGGGAVCGDETCDPGEDQCNCPEDCGTPPSTETNCDDDVDNDCDTYTDCDDVDCDGDPACPSCGDEICDSGEDQCNCPEDCGTPPSTETSCTDEVDNDCDTYTDCDDSDCDGDPACPDCALRGEPCTTDEECCSLDCNTGLGTCK